LTPGPQRPHLDRVIVEPDPHWSRTMRASILLVAALLGTAMPVVAQRAEGGAFPEGWSARVDRDQPVEDVVFATMGDGFHVTTGPAAVLYNPAWMHSGDYAVAARFTQTRAPEHPEAYGIVIGGSELDAEGQTYSYFLVRGTGEYFIATRTGAERAIVVPWTAHDAVVAQDDAGRQTNVLGARAAGDEVVFTINGAEVARRPRSEIVADGIFGFRVNHRLDVHIDQVEHEGGRGAAIQHHD
jgi:hypothetical protein